MYKIVLLRTFWAIVSEGFEVGGELQTAQGGLFKTGLYGSFGTAAHYGLGAGLQAVDLLSVEELQETLELL